MSLKFLLLIPTISLLIIDAGAKIHFVTDNRPVDYMAISIDIDQNGLWDAKIKKDPLSGDNKIQLAYTDALNYTSMNVISVAELNPTPFPYKADMLAAGQFIHSSQLDYFTIKNFNNQSARYIGILLVKNGAQYCAWIQILDYGTTALGLGDYGWEDDKTRCIYIGQTEYPSGAVLPSSYHNGLSVSPNPANDFIWINGSQSAVDLNILNSLGEKVLVCEQILSDMAIDISSLPSGIYYLFIEENNSVTRKKLLISK